MPLIFHFSKKKVEKKKRAVRTMVQNLSCFVIGCHPSPQQRQKEARISFEF
jgi:hypothetical protein